MPQWEYSRIDLSNIPARTNEVDLLDDAGRDGWELVGITANNVAYLKRPTGSPPAAADPPPRPPARRRSAS